MGNALNVCQSNSPPSFIQNQANEEIHQSDSLIIQPQKLDVIIQQGDKAEVITKPQVIVSSCPQIQNSEQYSSNYPQDHQQSQPEKLNSQIQNHQISTAQQVDQNPEKLSPPDQSKQSYRQDEVEDQNLLQFNTEQQHLSTKHPLVQKYVLSEIIHEQNGIQQEIQNQTLNSQIQPNSQLSRHFKYLRIFNEEKTLKSLMEDFIIRQPNLIIPEDREIVFDNVQDVEGLYKIQNDAYYSGEWNKNKFEGFGILYEKSSIYEGYFLNGLQNIYGRVIKSNGHIYEGNFKDGRIEGFGILTKLNGYTYEGEWLNNKKHGQGFEKVPNNYEYHGEFYNNYRQGEGKLINKDGSQYQGEFHKNKYHGKGILENEGFTYHGQFQYGKFHGMGQIIWKNGNSYQGYYVNGLKEGNGEFQWSDGTIYRGQFKAGKQNGYGSLFDKNGQECRYYWQKGKRIEKISKDEKSEILFQFEINKIQSEFPQFNKSKIGITNNQKEKDNEDNNQESVIIHNNCIVLESEKDRKIEIIKEDFEENEGQEELDQNRENLKKEQDQ